MRLCEAHGEEKVQRDALTYVEWGKKLELDGYLQREHLLRKLKWAEGGLKTWLLKDDRGDVLASCETYRMVSKVKETIGESYGIASVFCEARLRKRGYATQLLELLGEEVASWKGVQALILYSDVGAKIYEKVGYHLCSGVEWVFPAAPGDKSSGCVGIHSEELTDFAFAKAQASGSYAIVPTAGQIEWHLAREKFYAAQLGTPLYSEIGARLGLSRILWAVDYRSGRLQILYLDAQDVHDARVLLQQACKVAFEMGVKDVRIWEAEAALVWEHLDLPGKRVARIDKLPMIKPLVQGLKSQDWQWISRSTWV